MCDSFSARSNENVHNKCVGCVAGLVSKKCRARAGRGTREPRRRPDRHSIVSHWTTIEPLSTTPFSPFKLDESSDLSSSNDPLRVSSCSLEGPTWSKGVISATESERGRQTRAHDDDDDDDDDDNDDNDDDHDDDDDDDHDDDDDDDNDDHEDAAGGDDGGDCLASFSRVSRHEL